MMKVALNSTTLSCSFSASVRAGYIHIWIYEKYNANRSTPVDDIAVRGKAAIEPMAPIVTSELLHPAFSMRFLNTKYRIAGDALNATCCAAPNDIIFCVKYRMLYSSIASAVKPELRKYATNKPENISLSHKRLRSSNITSATRMTAEVWNPTATAININLTIIESLDQFANAI